MLSLLAITQENPQSGIPSFVWIIIAIVVALIMLVLAIKSFWVSKILSILLSIVGIIISIYTLINVEASMVGAISGGIVFAVCYVFLMGNAIFDSETEGDYLIFGTLVHDTNHPLLAFGYWSGGIIALSGLLFYFSYLWSFVIGLVAFAFTLILNIIMVIARIRG
ncbi:MAG: hypothetical protein IJA82_07270 [Clostridia bacterium]|nr:hypothetical protein [Clostridia bacterium]